MIATRLWYDRKLPTRYPANVLSGFEPSAGATFFNLNELQVREGSCSSGLCHTGRRTVGRVCIEVGRGSLALPAGTAPFVLSTVG